MVLIPINRKDMINFRQKNYASPYIDNVIVNALRGAGIGLAGSSVATGFKQFLDYSKNNNQQPGWKDKRNSAMSNFKMVLGSTLVGGAIGALFGLAGNLDIKHSQSQAGSDGLMGKLVRKLKDAGFKENADFTLSPKTATALKTRVTLVISKVSEDLKIVINSVNDEQVEAVRNKIMSVLPKSIVSTTEGTKNRFNDLTVTTVSKGKNDLDLCYYLAVLFMKVGIPVYLIEIG
jgi:hypothetical protein